MKRESKVDMWNRLAGEARAALEALKEMQDEYTERFDNMNEGLQASPYGQKLEVVAVHYDPEGSVALMIKDEAGALHTPVYPAAVTVEPEIRVVDGILLERVREEFEKCRDKWDGDSEPAALETLERLLSGAIV